MFDYLAANPLIALMAILALGYLLGKVNVAGISLGSAAVLFVSIAFSAVEPEIQLPPLLYTFGLALFVYAIGLSFGAQFFAEFRSRGWKISALAALVLTGVIVLAYVGVKFLGLDAAQGAGSMTGAVTSTPGMAAIVETMKASGITDPEALALPVIGYSLAYPGGVLGLILVAAVGAKLRKVDHVADAKEAGVITEDLHLTGLELGPIEPGTVAEVLRPTGAEVVATRLIHHEDPEHQTLITADTEVSSGDVLLIHGTQEELRRATHILGREVHFPIDDHNLDYRRFSVSNPQIVGRTIDELGLAEKRFLIARVRRGDSDFIPTPTTRLEYSDKVRVVTPTHKMAEARTFFGDSENALGNFDFFPFFLGLLAGLLVGMIPIPMPGGLTLSLGFGGGPILVGLILGWRGRTGRLQWIVPFQANKIFINIGLALFLAGVGTTAGAGFAAALSDVESLLYVGFGLVLTLVAAIAMAVLGAWVLGAKWDETMGMAGGISTNPAIIAYLNAQTGTDLAARGYATVYPVGMIGKIIGAQVLFLLLV
ncbi:MULTISPECIES: aspartate:alanine exchanger family transporter [Corynebacterium]|uniref:aspartate:alanine exchanger family transporter n=1 Tax=Corynebacterium TaxID=1716 RepID=UPI00124E0488|nr:MULTISPECIES: aspartate:alanine exchanger family transporter [Corynebacterium]